VHIATLWSISGDDAASGGGDDAVPAPQMDLFTAGAGFALNLTTATAPDTANDSVTTLGPVQDKNSTTDPIPTLGPIEDRNPATDPAPTLGPIEDSNSAAAANLAGTSGAGSLTANLGSTMLRGAAAGDGGVNVSPASSDNSPHFGAFGVGTLDDLMSGAAVFGQFGAGSVFGAGGVLVGAGTESGENGLAGPGVNGFFAALTGAYSPPAGQWHDLGAGSLNLDSQFSQLVQAMATYSADSPAFASLPITQVSNDSGLFGTIAAAVHG